MDKEKEESRKEKRERRRMERENKHWLEEEDRGRKVTGLESLLRKRHRDREELKK